MSPFEFFELYDSNKKKKKKKKEENGIIVVMSGYVINSLECFVAEIKSTNDV